MNSGLRLSIRVSAEGSIIDVNDEYLSLSGYSRGELVGESVEKIRVPYPQSLVSDMSQVLSSGQTYQVYAHEKKKNGEAYFALMSCTPVFDNGSYSGYVAIKKIISGHEEQKAKIFFEKLNNPSFVCVNGLPRRKVFHRSLGFLYRMKLTTLTIATASFFSSLIIGGAYLFELNQKEEISIASEKNYSRSLLSELNGKISSKNDLGSTNVVGIMKSDFIRKMVAEENVPELGKKLGTSGDYYRKYTDFKNIRLHIISEKGQSIYMSWKDVQKTKDVSGRSYVKHVLAHKKPTVVQAVSTSGYNIKAILPIEYDGQFEGFVEFIQGVRSIREYFSGTGRDYVMAIDTHYLANKTPRVQDANARNHSLSPDGRFVVGNNKQFSLGTSGDYIQKLNKINLEKLFENGVLFEDGAFHVSEPVLDVDGKVLGYHIVTEPSEKYLAYLEQNYAIAEQTLRGVALVLIFTVLSFLAFVYVFILRPLGTMKSSIHQAVKDSNLFARLPVYGNNELSEMGRAYNNQAMLTQFAFMEASTAISSIEKGALDYRINQDFHGEFGLLKASLNNSLNNLSETFTRLEALVNDMRSGNYSQVHSADGLEGVYSGVFKDCVTTMSNLKQVFSDVDSVLSFAKRGKFDARLEVSSDSGDIYVLSQTINQSLEHLESGFKDIVLAAQRMAGGDFSKPITSDYEFLMEEAKEAMNSSMVDLSQTVGVILDSVSDIQESIEKLESGTLDLSSRTQEQAASIEETSAAMEETSSQVESNLDSTRQASGIASGKEKILAEANGSMDESQVAMQKIKDTSERIQEITVLIDSIAFQTNLLALNAAVEAARAGEHGRGFAVVAGEVRALASKSAEAVKDINGLVDETSEAISSGVEQVNKVAEHLGRITRETQKMQSVVNGIAESSEQQARGVAEVNRAVSQIDSVTQNNAALVEQTTSSVSSISRSVSELSDIAHRFKVN